MIEHKVAAEFSIWVDRNIIVASLMPNSDGLLEVVEIYRESLVKRDKNDLLFALVDPRDWEVVGIISARAAERDLRFMPFEELTGSHYLLCPIYRVTALH